MQSSSFSRVPPMNDFFSSFLNSNNTTKNSSSSNSKNNNMNLSPDMAIYSSGSNNKPNLSSFSPNPHRSPHPNQQQRPVSEILKPENFVSPETQEIDKWFEDLQQYESSLESMATASLDPKYKEEVQHVDQWFRYLNEAERTATIYTLLQHSTQVQIRFFTAVLQQMNKTDPLGALLSPAHPEKDMQAQMAGAMVKAELEASQKLLSVLPYQTGQVISRPNANIGRRNHIDRHSFALGDTEEYDRIFSNNRNDFLSPSHTNSFVNGGESNLLSQQRRTTMQRNIFDNRPKSVIESDLPSIFNNDWSYSGGGGNLINQQQQQQQRPIAAGRPKSADISNWSFGASVSSSSKGNNKDPLASPWSGLSPTVSTFGEKQQQQQQQLKDDDLDHLSMMANNWHLNNNGGGSNRSSVILSDDTKGFRRRGMNRTSIPRTVPETDERILKNSIQSPPPPTPATLNGNSSPANIVLSMYDDHNTQTLFGTAGGDQQYNPYLNPTSPLPTQTTFNSVANLSPPLQSKSPQQQQFGQFLNPNDRTLDENNGYFSDHSESSSRSIGSTTKGHKKKFGAFTTTNNRSPPIAVKEKKNIDVVDMQLLEDVPAWLRSLRLHKYNPIFETVKWQDMLKMDDEALLGKGVTALGARRKLLKVFDQIKAHCQANNITY